jgi:hypothetical protein
MPYAAVQLLPFPLWMLLGYYLICVGGCGIGGCRSVMG